MTDQSTAPQPKSDDEPQEPDESQESIAILENKEELKKLLLAISQEFAGLIPPPSMMKLCRDQPTEFLKWRKTKASIDSHWKRKDYLF